MTDKEIEEHNELYRRGTALISPLIHLEGREPLTGIAEEEISKRLQEGIECLQECVVMEPDNWAALWFMGKAFQRLAQDDAGYQVLKAAYDCALRNVADVEAEAVSHILRELSFQCLATKRISEAVYYTGLAAELYPEDITLKCNRSLPLLISGKVDAAYRLICHCYEIKPDTVTTRMYRLIKAVHEGVVPRPMSYQDLYVEPYASILNVEEKTP